MSPTIERILSRCPLVFLGSGIVLLPCPASAQTALDRVDPARAEERVRTPELERSEDVPAIITEEPAPRAVDDTGVRVGAIQLAGLTQMQRADFADIVEQYLGRTLSSAELSSLADALAARARSRFPLATARIEPQAIKGGVLTVTIDEGRIDEVRVEGARNAAIDAALAPLAAGTPIGLGELERRLLIAGDIDGVTIGSSRIAREGDRNILIVKAGIQHVRAQVTIDNDSTKPLGPLEAYGTLRFNGVAAADDSVQIFVLSTLAEPDELAFGRLRYNKRLNASGTELALSTSYSRSAPGAYLERFDIVGESWFAGMSMLQPVLRRKRESLWLEGSIGYRAVDQDRAERLVRRDRLTVARAAVHGYGAVLGGTMRISTTLSQGLDLFGATEGGDPLASRDDADATFTAVSLYTHWVRPIAGPLGLRLAVRSQLTSQPLLVAEEVGLGGATFIRGYDYSERSGDQGTMASGELRYDWKGALGMTNSAQLYAFVDGGRVSNLDAGFGSGSLFATGGGVRADVNRFTDASFEVAVPLSGERYDTGTSDPKIRFSFTRYF